MSAHDVPMFKVPPPAPLTLTTMFAVYGSQKGAYSKYDVKGHVACHECIGVLHEGRGRGPAPRGARFSRKVPGKELLLCAEHTDMWRALDAEKFGAKR